MIFDTEGFEVKLIYNIENYTSILSYSHINADNIEDNATHTTGVDESIAIRRIGAYDSRKFTWSNYYDVDNTLSLGYTLNAVKGISSPIDRSGYVTHDISIKYSTIKLFRLDYFCWS